MNQSIFDIQAEFCKAMGNTVRLQLLHVLRERPMTVTKSSGNQNSPRHGVTPANHPAWRRVVASHRHGSTKVFEITDEKIAEVCDLVRSILVETDPQTLSIDRSDNYE